MMWTRYLKDETGAITVDWVVLTAALIGMCMLFLVPIGYSLDSVVDRVSDFISGLQTGYWNN